jgi:hypothetical protein
MKNLIMPIILILISNSIYAEKYILSLDSNHVSNKSIHVNEYAKEGENLIPTYVSCQDLLNNEPSTINGVYSLYLNGNTLDVECEIEGVIGWTAITPEIAYVLNGGVINELRDIPQVKGFENNKPYSASITINHNSQYNIPLGFNYTNFKLLNYQVKGAADKYGGSGSMDFGSSGSYTSWNRNVSGGWGDLAIGSTNDNIPSFSFYKELGTNQLIVNQIYSINVSKTFSVTSDNVLRIAWSQGGGQIEGIFPFWSGKILVK